MNATPYLEIKFRHLKGKKIIPFALFLLNPSNGKYYPFLFANAPLVQNKLASLESAFKNGGKLAIARKDLELFEKFAGLTESEVENDKELDSPVIHKGIAEGNDDGSGSKGSGDFAKSS